MQGCWFEHVQPARGLHGTGHWSRHSSPGCRRDNRPPSWVGRVALACLVSGKLPLSAPGTLSVPPA